MARVSALIPLDCSQSTCAQHGAHDLNLANRVALCEPLIQETLDHRDSQAGQPLSAQARNQVEATDHLVQVVSSRTPVALNEVFQPVLEVQAELPCFIWHGNACPGLLLCLAELVTGLVQGSAVDDDTLTSAGGCARVERTGPVAVLALVDRAVTVDPAPLTGL